MQQTNQLTNQPPTKLTNELPPGINSLKKKKNPTEGKHTNQATHQPSYQPLNQPIGVCDDTTWRGRRGWRWQQLS